MNRQTDYTLILLFGEDQESLIDGLLATLKDHVLSIEKDAGRGVINYKIVFSSTYGIYLFGYNQKTAAEDFLLTGSI